MSLSLINWDSAKSVMFNDSNLKRLALNGDVLWGLPYVYRTILERSIEGEYVNDTVESIGNHAFHGCPALTSVDFSLVTSIGDSAFWNCSALTSVDFPLVTSIGDYAFHNCINLTALILRSETMCTLSSTSAFTSTPIASGTGYIYVLAALVDSYKTATNWSTYANQIRAIENYPDICGGENNG